MANQFAPPPGYVPLDASQSQLDQTQTQQQTQPDAAAQNQTPAQGKFAPPPGYVPLNAPTTGQSSAQSSQTSQPEKSFWQKTKESLLGPDTALGAKTPEDVSGTVSGVNEILNGNVREGLSNIYQHEIASMHVIQGSPIEKIIQQFNPNFKGALTPSQAEAKQHQNMAGLENPVINVAQNIDKDKHPVWKAIAEATQSLTSPANVATLYATGGMGLVESPKALATANRLLSAGFSANAIGQAYTHLKDFKQAYDEGNASEALYSLTHSLLSGTLAIVSGAHATGNDIPFVSQADKNAVTTAGKTAAGIPGAVAKAPGQAVDFLSGIGAPKPTEEGLVGKITQGGREDLAPAARALKATDLKGVETYEDLRDALDSKVRENTATIDKTLGQDQNLYRAQQLDKITSVPGGRNIVTNSVQDAIDQLSKYYEKTNDTQGQAEMQTLQNKFNQTGLTLKEINDLAREHGNELNAYNANGELASGLSRQAAENTRQGVKEQVRQLAPHIQGIDSETSDLIQTRGLAEDMAEKVQSLENKLKDAGYWRKGAAALAKVIDTASGGFFKSLIKTGQEGAGAQNAVEIQDSLAKNIKKLDELNKMTPQQAAQQLNTPQVPAETEPGWGSVGPGVTNSVTDQQIGHHELGHVFMGDKHGFGPEEVISGQHPDLVGNPNKLAGTKFSMENMDRLPNGNLPAEKVRQNINGLLEMLMGGAAANEVVSGIKPSDNPTLAGDKREAAKLLKNFGFSQEEAQARVDAAYESAKAHISQPHIQEAIRNGAQTSEPNLPETHLFTGPRIQEILNGAREAVGNEGRTSTNLQQHGEANVGEGQGAGAGSVGQPAANAAIRGLKELTTGNPQFDSAIKAAGAIPAGKFLDYIQFHDPVTGSSLVLKPEDLTVDNIKAHMAKSREAFGIKAPEANATADTISERVPTGKNIEEDANGKAPLRLNTEAVNKSPGLLDKLANKVKGTPGFKFASNITDPAKIAQRYVDHIKSNLIDLYNRSTPEEKRDNAKWYESANKLASGEATKYGIPDRQAAGVIASLSPQKDWDMNVSLARRVMDIYHNQADTVATPEMVQKGRDIVAKTSKGDKIANEKLDGLLNKIDGKKLSELTDPMERAAWVRLHDETYNPREYHKIDPVTGDNLDVVRTVKGVPAKVAWGSLNQIGNALKILENPDKTNISEALGTNHKVRNFYNNIIDPENDHSVTIDTHAVAAGQYRPLSGNDTAVKDNFGGVSNAKTGSRGTYALNAEAYRQAAAELGIKPRELQSVTWEKIRNIFPAEWKTEGNKKAVDKIWSSYNNGKLNLYKARQAVIDLAQKPAETPAPKAVKRATPSLPKVPTGAQALKGE